MKIFRTLCALAVMALAVMLSPVASAASFCYDSFVDNAWAGNIGKANTVKVMLLGSGYTPSQTAHTTVSDIRASEVSGTGYTANGNTLTVTYTKDTTNHRLTVAYPSTTWTTSTITARYAAYYTSGGSDATSYLHCLDDFGGNVSTTAGTFTLNATTAYVGTPQ